MPMLKMMLLPFLTLLLGSELLAAGLPITLTWERINGYEPTSLNIQISNSPEYKDSLINEKLREDRTFIWQAPREGVFHYRIGQGEARKNIVIGSFVVLAATGSKEVTQVNWGEIKGAQSYTIRITETGNSSYSANTHFKSLVIDKKRLPQLIEIFPSNAPDQFKLIKTYNAELSLGNQQPPPIKSVAIATQAASPTQAITTKPQPENAGLSETTGSQDIGVAESSADNQTDQEYPSWHLRFGGLLVNESLSASDTIGTELSSTAILPGASLGFAGSLFGPLTLAGAVTRNKSLHTLAFKNGSNLGDSIIVDEDRTEGEAYLGLDVLGFGAKHAHHLILNGGIAYRQSPRLPLTDLAIERSKSGLLTVDSDLQGAGLSYIYFTKMQRLEISGSYFKGPSQTLAEKITLSVDVALLGHLTLNTNAFYDRFETETCDDVAISCRTLNSIASEKFGGVLGLGAAL